MSNTEFSMFRTLDEVETKQFQQWARDNYAPGTTISELWHPVVRDECRKINDEWQEPTKADNA